MKESRLRNAITLNEINHWKHAIENELFIGDSNQGFIFKKFILPKLDIAACHAFSSYVHIAPEIVHLYNTLEKNQEMNPYSSSFKPVSSPSFINLIPRNDHLICIIGYARLGKFIANLDVQRLGSITGSELIKFISDVLIRNIDTWALSETLYKKLLLQNKIRMYVELSKYFSGYSKGKADFNRDIEFNLFSNV
ncbi:MAG: hypothetical protein ACRYG7_44035 [Janthinobacterium lividum]